MCFLRPRFSVRPSDWTVRSVMAFLLAVGIVAIGCGPADEPAEEPAPAEEEAAEPAPAAGIDMSLYDDPARPDTDKAEDEGRKALQVYDWLGVEPGMTVADLYPGGGYNTQLLSLVVGEMGTVYSIFEFNADQEVMAGRVYTVDVVQERIDNAGLTNVIPAMRFTDVPDGTIDVLVAVRNYHDVENVFTEYKRADALAQIMRIMKPGGVVGIVDLVTPNEGWHEETHRLNKQTVIDDFTGAGFELVDESDLLANPEDDHTTQGFDVGRHTMDRYLLKFQKPQM